MQIEKTPRAFIINLSISDTKTIFVTALNLKENSFKVSASDGRTKSKNTRYESINKKQITPAKKITLPSRSLVKVLNSAIYLLHMEVKDLATTVFRRVDWCYERVCGTNIAT
jgi:hypothetical protein